jgi:fucose permease
LIAIAGVLTFAFLGAIQALYGPLLPGLQRNFGVGTSDVGLVFAAHGLGALTGIFLPSFIRAPAVANRWLSVATAMILVGAAAISMAPTWPALLAAAFVLALGFGIHVVRLNSLFVAGFGSRGMRMSQLINAGFSVGAISGPVVVGLQGEPSTRVFGGVALLALLLLPVNVLADRRGRAVPSAALFNEAKASRPIGSRLQSRVLLCAFATLMCFTSGAENSVAGWTTTLAIANGYSFTVAANFTAMFFGSILIGRLLAAAFGHRVQPAFLVIGGISCIAILLAIASLARGAPIALALAGFATAPIFSATLVWLGSALPTSAHANTIVIAGALLGSAVLPALVGRAVAQFGPAAAPPAILCTALAALGVAVWVQLARR